MAESDSLSDSAELADTDPYSTSTDTQISLQVGERRFTTTRSTLVTESSYFASLLSKRWDGKPDGSPYFVDADPDLFEHILRYLRHLHFPIFYDKAKGHDYGLYLALLGKARYFGTPRLQKWLEEKRYATAVQVYRTFQVYEDGESELERYKTFPTDTTVTYLSSWGTKKVYICPRGITVHRGEPLACGRQCHRAQGGGPVEYDDKPILGMLVVEEQVTIRPDVCISDE